MRETTARMLKGMHGGLALKRVVDRSDERRDVFYLMTWHVERFFDEPIIEVDETPREHRRGFSDMAHEGLMEGALVDNIPMTGTDNIIALTPAGLALAQRMFGPIQVTVMVKHDEGVETLAPAADGSCAVPTGGIEVWDFPDRRMPGP